MDNALGFCRETESILCVCVCIYRDRGMAYFKELGHLTVGVGKVEIYKTGRQFGNSDN